MLTHSVARRLASHPMRWRCASVVASASAGRAASGERILHPVPYQAQTSAVSADNDSRLGFAASYSSTPAPPRGELVRDYIHDSLYHPTEGYFTSRPVSVGVLSERLNFHRFQGQSEYTRRIGQLYVELSASWLTPVEIFRPWYAQALARYMLRQHQERCFAQGDATIPLLVYEIGGGSGTCARDVLDYIHSKAPAVHRTMRYTTVEISAALAAKQQLCVTEQGLHTDQFTVCAGLDAGKVESWGGVDERPCYVIMLEVLDNLPHDRVCNTSDGWMQTRVVPSNHTVGEGDSWAREESREELEPLTDPLIQRCLAAVHPNVQTRPSLLARAQNALAGLLGSRFAHTEFLPTASLALFDVLHTVRPAHRLIAADFDELPDVMVAGTTAPLVASKRDGKTQDHSTYIVPRGEADIFFPTDFDAVERIYRASREACTGVPAPPDSTKVLTTRSFFQRYGETWQTQTADGYNPMLEDFTNTRVLLSTAGPQDNRVSDILHDLMLHHSARYVW